MAELKKELEQEKAQAEQAEQQAAIKEAADIEGDALVEDLKKHMDKKIDNEFVATKEELAKATQQIKELRAHRLVMGIKGMDKEMQQSLAKDIVNIANGALDAGRETAAAVVTDIDARGGFLMPEEWSSEIMYIAETAGYAMQQSFRFETDSGTANVPSSESSFTNGFQYTSSANASNEDQDGPEKDPTFLNTKIELINWLPNATVSNNALEDSAASIVDWMTIRAGEGLAYDVDGLVFIGGSGMTGIEGASGVNTVPGASGALKPNAAITPATILALVRRAMGRVPASMGTGGSGLAFYMHPSTWAVLLGAETTNRPIISVSNGEILTNNGLNGVAPVGTLYGRPVYLSDHFVDVESSTNDANGTVAVFANLRKTTVVATKGGMTVARDTSNQVKKDQSVFVFKQRVATGVTLPKGIGRVAIAAS